MELEAAVRGRRSIRKFRPDPIPRNVLEEPAGNRPMGAVLG